MANKRKNKSKKEIVHDIKDVQEADRKREIVRKQIYPFLLELNNNIGYTKIFLQTAATAVEKTFTDTQRTVKIKDILPKLKEVFTSKENQPEMDMYIKLFEILQDESVYNFSTIIQYMPRVIEQHFTMHADKKPILDLDINKILG